MDTGARPGQRDKPLNRGDALPRSGPSLSATKAKLEQERVDAENQRLLQRITEVRAGAGAALRAGHAARGATLTRRSLARAPQTATRHGEYDPRTLAKSAADQEAYMKRISRYPPPK